MANLFCPAYFDEMDQNIPGPHAFTYGENKLIFCMACGEVRELDPGASLPTAPAVPPPNIHPPKPRGNGILP